MLLFNKWYNLFNILAVVEYIQRPIIYPYLNSPVTLVSSLEAIVAYVFLFSFLPTSEIITQATSLDVTPESCDPSIMQWRPPLPIFFCYGVGRQEVKNK